MGGKQNEGKGVVGGWFNLGAWSTLHVSQIQGGQNSAKGGECTQCLFKCLVIQVSQWNVNSLTLCIHVHT